MKARLAADIQRDSIVDGEGLRSVIWFQGCPHRCNGCHNPESHSFDGGFEIDIDELKVQIRNLELQDGITLSGGDPLSQPKAALECAKTAKENNMNVWCYTGYTFEQVLSFAKTNPIFKELLNNIDVLIDGKFEIDKKSLSLHFKGSSNQRVIDVKKSLIENQVVLIEKYKN